jgi:hypothetical protein
MKANSVGASSPAFTNFSISQCFASRGSLTVVKGDGQFTDSTGELVKEASFILILLYRPTGLFGTRTAEQR